MYTGHTDHLGIIPEMPGDNIYNGAADTVPVLILLITVFIDITLLRYKPQFTWPGLIIVLLGIPVYFLRKRNMQSRAARTG